MLYGNIDLEKYIIIILHFDNIHILIKLFLTHINAVGWSQFSAVWPHHPKTPPKVDCHMTVMWIYYDRGRIKQWLAKGGCHLESFKFNKKDLYVSPSRFFPLWLFLSRYIPKLQTLKTVIYAWLIWTALMWFICFTQYLDLQKDKNDVVFCVKFFL